MLYYVKGTDAINYSSTGALCYVAHHVFFFVYKNKFLMVHHVICSIDTCMDSKAPVHLYILDKLFKNHLLAQLRQ